MALTTEWRKRIDRWRNELKNHFYRPLGTVDFSGFVTTEQLSPQEALQRDFRPMPPGTAWGAKWEYAWFRGTVRLPEEAAGRRIALRPETGGESLVFVNGAAAGSADRITLSREAKPGDTFDILIESYAGHGPTPCHSGPTPPGRRTVPEPGPTQREVKPGTFGVWEEDAFQLWMDVETLYLLRDHIDQNSLRVAEVDRGLRDFTTICDFELPREQMLETVRATRDRLKPLLECRNGSTAPVLYAFGHSHLDVGWLWPFAHTERKAAITFANQLALMDEYPQYRYLQSQPHLCWMTKTRYPELYERVVRAARSGQLMPEGGMWVEADTNVSGGEALIRQFVHGRRFFRDEFSVDCELLWLPDVFGYSGALPQIMRGCGIRYFSTAKIFWVYNGGDPFPYTTFTWEGIDGSTVLVNLCNNYNSETSPRDTIGRWNERLQKDGIWSRLFPFGKGDGGHGASRNHMEFLIRQQDLEGAPRMRIASPLEYFRDLEQRGVPEARYVGELYYQAHRGTYTSQARTKRLNRKSEFALREAEMWGAIASATKGAEFPVARMEKAWRTHLLNQFHDVLPGSSIKRVYEDAEAGFAEVIAAAAEVEDNARGAIAGSQNALVVFNSLSWKRTALVPLPERMTGAAGPDGTSLAVQVTEGIGHVEVEVPSCGWTTITPASPAEVPNALKADQNLIENGVLRIELNDRGEITSIFDKEARREFAAGPCSSFRMFKDIPSSFDAWDIDSMYELTPAALDEPARVEVIAAGPLEARLRARRTLNDSTLSQDIVLRRGARRVEFHTTVDWNERHKLLKVAFPVAIHADHAVHEIQFGHIQRPNHFSRPFDADRFEVCSHKWSALVEGDRGFAVLNDCKYGLNVRGNTINLTLLKSALAPDMTADRGRQEFVYAIYPWHGSLAESGVVREAYELNCPCRLAAGQAGSQSAFAVDAPNVVIEAVKLAEDGSGDLVVRLYEAMRTATRCAFTTTLPVKGAAQTDLLENPGGELALKAGALALEFRPFEIKTIRLMGT